MVSHLDLSHECMQPVGSRPCGDMVDDDPAAERRPMRMEACHSELGHLQLLWGSTRIEASSIHPRRNPATPGVTGNVPLHPQSAARLTLAIAQIAVAPAAKTPGAAWGVMPPIATTGTSPATTDGACERREALHGIGILLVWVAKIGPYAA